MQLCVYSRFFSFATQMTCRSFHFHTWWGRAPHLSASWLGDGIKSTPDDSLGLMSDTGKAHKKHFPQSFWQQFSSVLKNPWCWFQTRTNTFDSLKKRLWQVKSSEWYKLLSRFTELLLCFLNPVMPTCIKAMMKKVNFLLLKCVLWWNPQRNVCGTIFTRCR